jgi:hypothetical protein
VDADPRVPIWWIYPNREARKRETAGKKKFEYGDGTRAVGELWGD